MEICRDHRSVLRSVILGLLFLIVLCSPLAGDLDIGFPPGSPLEWRYELPFHRPDPYRGPGPILTPGAREEAPQPPEKDAPQGRTVVVKPRTEARPPPPLPRFGSFNPMGAARILTFDITGHLPWTSWKKQDSPPGELDYPPRARADLHWLTLSAFLRPLMHPARCSISETVQFLILIGQPVHETLENCEQGLGAAKELIQYLRANVPAVPAPAPDPRPLLAGVDDPEKRMLIAWAARELASDHLHAYNPLYARRILSLGGEAMDVLIACSRSEHPVLRANAAGILSAYDSPDQRVRAELLRLFKGKDSVARNRALEGLARYADPEAEALLIRSLSSRDRHFAVHAMRVLGGMGSLKAVAPIQGALRVDHKDHGDAWLAGVAALSRLPDENGFSRRLLAKLGERVEASASAFDYRGTAFPVDVPDRPGDRARLIIESIIIAMARLGDAEAKAEFLKILREPPREPPGGNQQIFLQRTRDSVLGNIEVFNQILAVETLGTLGDDGRELLRKVARASADLVLRGLALDLLERRGDEGAFILEVAENSSSPSALRVQALEALAEKEEMRPKALDVAERIVKDYLASGKGGGVSSLFAQNSSKIPSFECLSAVKLLGKHRPLPVEKLLELLEAAQARGDFERFLKREVPAGGPGQIDTVTLQAYPALFETVVVELGRLGDPGGLEKLEKVLSDPGGPGRPEAATALGRFRSREGCDALIAALGDRDRWVRYAAYRGLRQIAGKDHFADWLFGSEKERGAAAAKWTAWRAESEAELPNNADLIEAEKKKRTAAEEEARRKKDSGEEKKKPVFK